MCSESSRLCDQISVDSGGAVCLPCLVSAGLACCSLWRTGGGGGVSTSVARQPQFMS